MTSESKKTSDKPLNRNLSAAKRGGENGDNGKQMTPKAIAVIVAHVPKTTPTNDGGADVALALWSWSRYTSGCA